MRPNSPRHTGCASISLNKIRNCRLSNKIVVDERVVIYEYSEVHKPHDSKKIVCGYVRGSGKQIPLDDILVRFMNRFVKRTPRMFEQCLNPYPVRLIALTVALLVPE